MRNSNNKEVKNLIKELLSNDILSEIVDGYLNIEGYYNFNLVSFNEISKDSNKVLKEAIKNSKSLFTTVTK